MNSFAKGMLDYITPVLKESRFEEGVLTPEEFVAAGDLLVVRCGTWQWESGDSDKVKPYLPADKQFLITRNVPCEQRVRHLHTGLHNEETLFEEGQPDDDAWVATHMQREDQTAKLNIPDMNEAVREDGIEAKQEEKQTDAPAVQASTTTDNQDDEGEDSDSIPDIDDFEEDNNLMANDPASLGNGAGCIVREEPDNILHTRTYDVTITYDKYYQTPRVWLFGYDEHHQPLTTEQVFEDISQDHAHKTVTMEQHPHLPLTQASIHPCRHAATMKRILANVNQDAQVHVRVDQYIFVFLKFISAVVPTMQYDYTLDAQGR